MEQKDRIPSSDSNEPDSFDGRLNMTERAEINLSDPHEHSSDSSSSEKETSQSVSSTPRKVVILASLCLIAAIQFEALSMIAPFYPLEAAAKGVSTTVVGLIFGTYAFLGFIFVPIVGFMIAKYGPKSVLFVGMLLGGTAVILFGFCGRISGTAAFVVLSFLLRSISAIGGAASETSVTSIVIAEFPDNLGMASGFVQTCIGVGLSLGAVLGGALYSAGGFQLPFFVIGSSMIVPIPVLFYVLSNKGKTPSQEKASFSIIKALKIPAVLIVAGCCAAGGIMFTFMEPILGPHLKKTMNQNTTQIGTVFLVNAATYAIVTPLAGWIGDKTKCYRWLTVLGFIGAGFAYLLQGPAPFLTFILPTKSVWLAYVAMLINGFSWAWFFVQLVPQLVQIIRDKGVADNSTNAVVASIFSCMFYLGATIGPTLAGILDEHIGFQWTMVVASSISFAQAIILIAFTLLEETEVGSRIKSYSSDGEEELMLDSKHKQETGYYRSLDG